MPKKSNKRRRKKHSTNGDINQFPKQGSQTRTAYNKTVRQVTTQKNNTKQNDKRQ